jgi:hypothetical protein
MYLDFEKGKAFLKKAGSDGKTLYDHLTTVLLEVVKEKPENPLAAFESISIKVKNGAADPIHYKELPPLPVDSIERVSATIACLFIFVHRTSNIFLCFCFIVFCN